MEGGRDVFEGQTCPRNGVGHAKMFFETLVHGTCYLKLRVENKGGKQGLVGLDDPYPLGEMDSEKQSSYPGKIIDLAMERDIITPDQADGMWDEHVVRWLFGSDEVAKKAFYKRVRSQ
mgnify:CR=1 FL=1